ncbi:MAG: AcrR family transcriptional regulator [Paracoccaceae bacterium]|jgi:AcrR family transcriptional regulator
MALPRPDAHLPPPILAPDPCPDADHRPRVGRERRARMHRRLIESAVSIFARKGADASVISDVILEAGVSRGTFYNYFPSNADLLFAVKHALGAELKDLVDARVADIDDPAARIATGMRLIMGAARDHPLFGQFVARIGLQTVGPGSLIYDALAPFVAQGVAQGRFADAPPIAALDMIAGIAAAGVTRMSGQNAPPDHADHVAASILRGLGVAPPEALALATAPLARLAVGPDTLLGRST